MNILNILDEEKQIISDKILLEMTDKELVTVIQEFTKKAKEYGYRVRVTRHFAEDRLLNKEDKTRSDIEAVDLYKTLIAFLKRMENALTNTYPKQNISQKRFVITNERTNLNVMLVTEFNLRQSNVPHDLVLVTAQINENFRTDDTPGDVRVKVNV
jgi:hypothetical protein